MKGQLREFYRVETCFKLQGELRITSIGTTKMRSKPAMITFKNLSGNGLAFVTELYFDWKRDIEAEFMFKLMNTDVVCKGKIIRMETDPPPFSYLYGVGIEQSSLSEDEMHQLLMKCGRDFENVTYQNSSRGPFRVS